MTNKNGRQSPKWEHSDACGAKQVEFLQNPARHTKLVTILDRRHPKTSEFIMPPRWILRYNIKFFQVYHLLGLIPFRVDQNGQSALDKTGISWKARQWINISLGIFSALFVALRFFQDTALKKSSGDIWMVLIHAIFLAGSSSMTIWNVHLFWRRPELANKVYNELIQSVRNGMKNWHNHPF